MPKHVHVIINPAAGPDKPILNTLNTVFREKKIHWSVSITKKAGDACRQAEQAADSGADIIAIYGGDGSVMEAASGLMNRNTPLAIFPGGTANVMSVELGIPQNLSHASALVDEGAHQIREVDMGRLNGEHLFILRYATGFEAQMTKRADRHLKDRVGKLAYTLAGIMALKSPLNAHYKFELDGGQTVESEGVSCMIANTSNLGLPGVDVAPGADVSDGLLDVVVFKKAEHDMIMTLLTFNVNRSDDEILADLEKMRITDHWQSKKITITADPVQDVIIDGEVVGQTPSELQVVPKAVKILVPKRDIA